MLLWILVLYLKFTGDIFHISILDMVKAVRLQGVEWN